MFILKAFILLFIFPGLLFLSVGGMIVHWVDRKVTALVQSRVGPPIYQGLADILKLLQKETLVPEKANRAVFLLAPIMGFTGVLLSGIILLSILFGFYGSFLGDSIVIIYLLALPSLAIIIGGSSSANPISSIGASRETKLMLAYELCLLVSFAVVFSKHGSFLINEIFSGRPAVYSISGVIVFIVSIFCMQAKLGFVPFDIAEAETELMAGPFTEYSGPPLALFFLTKFMLFFFFPIFMIAMFWGGTSIIGYILKYLLVVVIAILMKNTNPRVRIDQALKFFWVWMFGLTIISLVLTIIGRIYGIVWL